MQKAPSNAKKQKLQQKKDDNIPAKPLSSINSNKRGPKLPASKAALESPYPVPWQKPTPSDSEQFVEALKKEISTHGKDEIIAGTNAVMRSLERAAVSLVFVSGDLQIGIILQGLATLCQKTDAAFVALLLSPKDLGKVLKLKSAIAIAFPKTSTKHQTFIAECRSRAPKLNIPWLSNPHAFQPTKMTEQKPKRPAALAAVANAPARKKKKGSQGQQQQEQPMPPTKQTSEGSKTPAGGDAEVANE